MAEAIQTILRREGYPNPYEVLKGLTRTNEKIDQKSISDFIDTLDVSENDKKRTKADYSEQLYRHIKKNEPQKAFGNLWGLLRFFKKLNPRLCGFPQNVDMEFRFRLYPTRFWHLHRLQNKHPQ